MTHCFLSFAFWQRETNDEGKRCWAERIFFILVRISIKENKEILSDRCLSKRIHFEFVRWQQIVQRSILWCWSTKRWKDTCVWRKNYFNELDHSSNWDQTELVWTCEIWQTNVEAFRRDSSPDFRFSLERKTSNVVFVQVLSVLLSIRFVIIEAEENYLRSLTRLFDSIGKTSKRQTIVIGMLIFLFSHLIGWMFEASTVIRKRMRFVLVEWFNWTTKANEKTKNLDFVSIRSDDQRMNKQMHYQSRGKVWRHLFDRRDSLRRQPTAMKMFFSEKKYWLCLWWRWQTESEWSFSFSFQYDDKKAENTCRRWISPRKPTL